VTASRGARSVDAVETEYRHADGSLVSVEMRLSPLRDASGIVCGASAILRDLSKRRHAETRLAEQIERLRALAKRPAPVDPPAQATVPRLAEDPVHRVVAMAREHLGMDVAWLAEFTDGRMVFRDLDGERDFFGLDVGEGIPLEGSYCRRMVDGEIANLVPDARTEPCGTRSRRANSASTRASSLSVLAAREPTALALRATSQPRDEHRQAVLVGRDPALVDDRACRRDRTPPRPSGGPVEPYELLHPGSSRRRQRPRA